MSVSPWREVDYAGMRGRAVQVEPIKPALKALGTNLFDTRM